MRNGQRVRKPGSLFLRHKTRDKDGKEHRYWSIVENRRVAGSRTVQRERWCREADEVVQVFTFRMHHVTRTESGEAAA